MSSTPLEVNCAQWAYVEALIQTAGNSTAEEMSAAVAQAANFTPLERDAIRVALGRALYEVVRDRVGPDAVSYQTIHDLARSIYVGFSDVVRLDVVALEHLLRHPFRKSTWPTDELDFAAYALVTSVALHELTAPIPDPLDYVRALEVRVGQWLNKEQS